MTAAFATAATGAVLLLGLLVATSKALPGNIFGLDRGLAAIFFGAKRGETISLIVAQWQAAGSRAGCRWCAFLDFAVERGHCAKQLDPSSPATPIFSGLRAGICLLLLGIALAEFPNVVLLAVHAVWTLVLS